jgi:NAD+ synthase (glutamine-hydrolysing)
MKIALAQINVQAGNFERNTNKIRQAIQQAKDEHADLVVFPELAVCGYPPRDFLTYPDFIHRCEEQIQLLLPQTYGIGVLLGCPSRNPSRLGKDLLNSAWFLAEGKVQQLIHKTLLPNYDVFDEYRYFEPNSQFSCIQWRGKTIAVTICEDIWDIHDDNPLYVKNPMHELMAESPDLMVNLSASPFNSGQWEKRHEVLQKNALRFSLPIVYVNQMGAHTELVFDGGSTVMDAQGNYCIQSPFFQESLITVDFNKLTAQQVVIPGKYERIHQALVLGVRDYFQKLGFKKAVIGLSGGVDRA